MQEAEEDDDYSDDGLDDLPPNTFQELQQNAIRSTQKTTPLDESYLLPAKHVQELGQSDGSVDPQPRLRYGQADFHRPSSDYGDLEDDGMLDGEVYDAAQDPPALVTQGNLPRIPPMGESTQREIWRQQQFSAPRHYHQANLQLNVEREKSIVSDNHHVSPGTEERMSWSPERQRDRTNDKSQDQDINALQAQIQQLLQERDLLRQESEAAKASTLAKAGEIAIVRARQLKNEKGFEQRLANLQKSHADEAARQKLEIQNAHAEKQRIATEKEFLESDLAQQKTVRAAAKKPSAPSPLATPNKDRAAPFADGFEKTEVNATSPPSRLTFRTKVTTPKAGAKRKRKVGDQNHAKPLELSQSRSASLSAAEPAKPDDDHSEPEEDLDLRPRNERYQLTQEILDHRQGYDASRTIELLAQFAFPSNADAKLSTLLFDKISAASNEDDDAFPPAIALVICSLWQQCLEEKYLGPLELIMNLVLNLLYMHLRECTPQLIDTLVPLAQTTADINLVPRHVKKPASELSPHISTALCIHILHTIAHNVLFDQIELERFWRCIRFDFTGMFLRPTNPVPELLSTLSLLKTSILPSTFAMIIPPDDGNQQTSEFVVLDLLSRLLVEKPWVREGEDEYPDEDICALRHEVLAVMNGMLTVDYGGRALACSPHCLPRLVRFLCDEYDALYDYTTEEMNELRSEGINKGFMVWHIAQKEFGDQGQNLQDRLKEMPGMIGKQLIVLTRLAFCEGGFFEGHIEEEVSELAHDMLEEVLTLEEGEEIAECMGSVRK